MTVLFVCSRFDGSAGDAVYAAGLAAGLHAEGVKVHVITVRDGEFVHLEVGEGRAVHSSRKKGPGIWEENFLSRTAPEFIGEVIRRVRPALIHVHGIHQFYTISAMRALGRSRIPVVMSLHDYKILCGNAGFFSDRTNSLCLKCLGGSVLPPLAERCKKGSLVLSAGTSLQMGLWKLLGGLDVVSSFVVASSFVRDILSENKKIAPRITVLPFPNMTTDSPAEEEHRNVVFIGRFVPLKGILLFAEAVKGLGVRVDLFGSGPLEQQAKDLLAQEPSVTFHGWKDHQTIARQSGYGSIVILPYLAYETFCLAAVESMSRRSCVIAAARGSLTELIDTGRTGILVKDPTAESFRKELVGLLADRGRVLRIGTEAAVAARLLPTVTQHSRAMAMHYEGVLSAPRRPV